MRKNDTDKNEFNYSHYPFYAENTYRYNNSTEAEDYKTFVYDTYLKIPSATENELRKIAEQEGFLDSELTVSEKIEMVKNYISNSKTYSLKTPKCRRAKILQLGFSTRATRDIVFILPRQAPYAEDTRDSGTICYGILCNRIRKSDRYRNNRQRSRMG